MQKIYGNIEKNPHFSLDSKADLDDIVISLQTLHRMPSEQWGYRPVFPTVFFCLKNPLRSTL